MLIRMTLVVEHRRMAKIVKFGIVEVMMVMMLVMMMIMMLKINILTIKLL